MKNLMINEDCYADVSGWSEEEVEQAAEIFKESVEGIEIDNIEVRPGGGYVYLMYLERDVFVGSMSDILAHGREIEVSKEQVFMESKEPTKQASGMCSATTLDLIKTFTMNHKDIEISFESGKINVRDWVGDGDPVEYVVEDAEQLEELMGTLESLNKFKIEG